MDRIAENERGNFPRIFLGEISKLSLKITHAMQSSSDNQI